MRRIIKINVMAFAVVCISCSRVEPPQTPQLDGGVTVNLADGSIQLSIPVLPSARFSRGGFILNSEGETEAIIDGSVVEGLLSSSVSAVEYSGKKIGIIAFVTNGMGQESRSERIIYSVPTELKELSFSKSTYSMVVGKSQQFSVSIIPDDKTERLLDWSIENSSVASVDSKGLVVGKAVGQTTLTVKSREWGVSAKCSLDISPDYTLPVDLGLSVKWAQINVGSIIPSDYGNYYAWGETAPKKEYSWATYKWCNGTKWTMTKYNSDSSSGVVDNKKSLDRQDDVAYVEWGGKWRTPTEDEWKELFKNCSTQWIVVNGHYGREMKSNVNGKSIFLPAAGFYNENGHYGVDEDCYYWSSYCGKYSAAEVFSGDKSMWGMSYRDKYEGLSVRPVCD